MPLTPFQRGVARILAKSRNPESYVAGGAAINRGESGLRISEDLDIFHDASASVALSAETDASALRAAGYAVDWTLRREGFVNAVARLGDESLKLDWTTDSAFRFFPVLPDEDFGYVLHPADLATNKVLALAGRTEIRDFLDMMLVDQTYLSLGAVIWAACGKDAGFTPQLLLDNANRQSRFQPGDLASERLVRPVDLAQLKRAWLTAREGAEMLFGSLPAEELGCLYLNPQNEPVTPDPGDAGFASLQRHRGSVRGAWPTIS